MRGFHVHLRNLQIAPDHLHRIMPEDVLQGENVTPTPQILNGKGVPEAVWMRRVSLYRAIQRIYSLANPRKPLR